MTAGSHSFSRLAAPRPVRFAVPYAWHLRFGVVITAIVSALVGYAVSVSATYAAAGVIAVTVAILVLFWPRQSSMTTYNVLLYTAILAYLVPLFALGKVYATIGVSPVYLPDVLLIAAAVLMLPFVRLRFTKPLPLMCALIAILALHSVYAGYQNGYHGVIRGLILALYPLIAVVIAGWLSNQSDAERLLAILPKYVLPSVAIGLVALLVMHATVIAAAAGLYLAVAGAFAVVPGMPRRRLLGISFVAGTIMLVGYNAKRGPALTILLALVIAWFASRRFRSDTKTIVTALAIGMTTATIALTIATGVLVPSQIPVAGTLVGRALATQTATTSEDITAANNVGIREAMWSYALHTADKDPLLGVGAEHPIEVDYHGNNLATQTTGPHNSFIGYAFYAGYPAAALVVVAFAIGLVRMWRLRQASIYAPALLGALVAVIMTAMTNVAFETTYIGGPSWLVLGAALGLAGVYRNRVLSSEAFAVTSVKTNRQLYNAYAGPKDGRSSEPVMADSRAYSA